VTRRVGVLTTGRQDWGILRSTCAAIQTHPGLTLDLLVGGTHLSVRHGRTIGRIRDEGFPVAAELDWLHGAESGGHEADPWPEAQASGALALVGERLREHPVDALLLVGDRLETAAAALAATLATTPIAHLHGGEQTLGAFDDALRHAITKLSHLHLVSHEEHARRVIAMGEDPASVHVVGAPGLDNATRGDLPDRAALETALGIALRPPVVVVTVHPATLDTNPAQAATAVAAAMRAVPATYVVTLPNTDPGAAAVRAAMLEVATATGGVAVDALGESRYWGLMRIADAMLGNSSSALIEAPAVGLPAVNVGDRQAGRRREANVLDVPADPDAVAAALRTALTPAFRERAAAARPPLADGRAGERVAAIIAAWTIPRPPRKPPIPA
jgi:UDP-hydrolysing UDP-N-acetyl-D-glucosamine 2-epimerase